MRAYEGFLDTVLTLLLGAWHSAGQTYSTLCASKLASSLWSGNWGEPTQTYGHQTWTAPIHSRSCDSATRRWTAYQARPALLTSSLQSPLDKALDAVVAYNSYRILGLPKRQRMCMISIERMVIWKMKYWKTFCYFGGGFGHWFWRGKVLVFGLQRS